MSDDFALYVADLLAPLGAIRPKRMFGGFGLYCNELIFALVIDDTLYLCADDEMRAAFGTGPFRYMAKGRQIEVKRYHEVPAALLDEGEALIPWADRAIRAATIPAATARRKTRHTSR